MAGTRRVKPTRIVRNDRGTKNNKRTDSDTGTGTKLERDDYSSSYTKFTRKKIDSPGSTGVLHTPVDQGESIFFFRVNFV